jgi:branched-chain amino acid transport system ATP-binding protein
MLLEVEHLNVSYGDIEAVCDVGFTLERGELVSIIGANGAGKSSILNSIMGIVPIKKGSIRFKGREIATWPAYHRARAGMRLVPERARVFTRLTVFENLLTGVYGLRKTLALQERLQWLYGFFPILEERKNQAAGSLSGGEQQQLAIARALISKPELLLVDEVSMGLMPKLVDEVFDLLKQLNAEFGLSILLVEQNAAASLAISQRAYVLEIGICAYQGEAKALLEDPKVQEVYLGR